MDDEFIGKTNDVEHVVGVILDGMIAIDVSFPIASTVACARRRTKLDERLRVAPLSDAVELSRRRLVFDTGNKSV